jgi:hypothetical protein
MAFFIKTLCPSFGSAKVYLNSGSFAISPPFMADSWAHKPVAVQLAD